MHGTIPLAIAGIVVLGIGAQLLAWRIGLPSILLLLVFGFLAGPITGFLDPGAIFGDELLFPLISVCVALILYEGGLSLSVRDLPAVGGVVRRLVTIGAAITWAGAAVGAHYIFGLNAGLAALLGALLVVDRTDGDRADAASHSAGGGGRPGADVGRHRDRPNRRGAGGARL